MTSPCRWLELAARARQWSLDEQGQQLHLARDAEERAQAERDGHTNALDAAHAGQRELMRSDAFGAAELARHARFEHALRVQAAQSEAALLQARQEADQLRSAMRNTLGERDAYQHRSELLRQRQREEQARATVRQLDETWLMRNAFRNGTGDEN